MKEQQLRFSRIFISKPMSAASMLAPRCSAVASLTPWRALLVVLLGTLLACGARDPSPWELKAARLEGRKVDEGWERESEAYFQYLLGQLAYEKRDFDGALGHFRRAGQLMDEPETVLSGRLAELHLYTGDIEKALAESEKSLALEPDNPELLLLQANILSALERETEAEQYFRRAIKADPDNNESYVLLALMYLRQEKLAQGIAVLKDLLRRKPDEPEGYYYLGRIYEAQGKLEQALSYYQKTARLREDNAVIGMEIARVYILLQRVDEAKDFCRRLVEADPQNLPARRLLSQIAVQENDWTGALEHLQVIDRLENDGSARFKMALIQLEMGDFAAARISLVEVLQQNPDFDDARFYLGTALVNLDRQEEAVFELLKIKPEQGAFERARILAAHSLRQSGQAAKAEDLMRQAWRQQPTNSKLLLYYAALLRESRKYREAETELAQALGQHQGDAELWFNYGVVLHAQGKGADAAAAMETVLQIDNNHADALNFVAYTLAEDNRELDRALLLIGRALEQRPEDPYFIDTRGWIYYQLGRYRDAYQDLRAAAGALPDDTVVLEHLGAVLEKLGQPHQALAVYQRALESGQDSDDLETQAALERIRERIGTLFSPQDSQ